MDAGSPEFQRASIQDSPTPPARRGPPTSPPGQRPARRRRAAPCTPGCGRFRCPEEPGARPWRAATLLREHRGDRHNAAPLAHGIGGTEAHVLLAPVPPPD
ncbi:helix-turn-helix domain-containing protein [Krasilnikovia sp. MM14-A1004]|uniref:helix-turn-helix domain-containing protein n=1 Tax=Krasilnikovia sp. MM14-A1004 TaxID=3373541 RepID=UPI00399D2F19